MGKSVWRTLINRKADLIHMRGCVFRVSFWFFFFVVDNSESEESVSKKIEILVGWVNFRLIAAPLNTAAWSKLLTPVLRPGAATTDEWLRKPLSLDRSPVDILDLARSLGWRHLV